MVGNSFGARKKAAAHNSLITGMGIDSFFPNGPAVVGSKPQVTERDMGEISLADLPGAHKEVHVIAR